MNTTIIKTFNIGNTSDIEKVDDSTVRAVLDIVDKNLGITNLDAEDILIVKIENCTGAERANQSTIELICDQFDLYNTIICADASTIFNTSNPKRPNAKKAINFSGAAHSVLERAGFVSISGDIMIDGNTDLGRELLDKLGVE